MSILFCPPITRILQLDSSKKWKQQEQPTLRLEPTHGNLGYH